MLTHGKFVLRWFLPLRRGKKRCDFPCGGQSWIDSLHPPDPNALVRKVIAKDQGLKNLKKRGQEKENFPVAH